MSYPKMTTQQVNELTKPFRDYVRRVYPGMVRFYTERRKNHLRTCKAYLVEFDTFEAANAAAEEAVRQTGVMVRPVVSGRYHPSFGIAKYWVLRAYW